MFDKSDAVDAFRVLVAAVILVMWCWTIWEMSLESPPKPTVTDCRCSDGTTTCLSR